MDLIGLKVHHITLGEGTVIKLEEKYITVEFVSKTALFEFPDAFAKYITALDQNVQTKILELISQPSPLPPPPPVQRKRKTFIVFQGMTFDQEYRGGYIWAPITNKAGVAPHYWKRLCDVRKDDIILHCCDGYIKAISTALGSYYSCPQPNGLYGDWDRNGRRVNCDYIYLRKPIKTSTFKKDIIRICGGKPYSPFDVNGNGNMGYLFDLDINLARIFIEACINTNSQLSSVDYICELIEGKV